jgi:hypothetical protein
VSNRVSEPKDSGLWGVNAPSCVGRIVRVTAEGRAWVDYPGNPHGPVPARSVVELSQDTAQVESSTPVLLVFERGDPSQPIIVGMVRDTLVPSPRATAGLREAIVDGKRITLDAQEEILLRCGKSSILLRKDGKIVVKGGYIVSRSSGAHKIQGASVNIN